MASSKEVIIIVFVLVASRNEKGLNMGLKPYNTAELRGKNKNK